MNQETKDLIKKYFNTHSSLIAGSILLAATSHLIDTIVVPKLFAKVITSGSNGDNLKDNLSKFLLAFGAQKSVYIASNYYGNQIEPSLTEFLTKEFTATVIQKYQATGEPIQVAITMDKISLLRTVIEDIIYYLCFKLIPLVITLVITVFTIFSINFKLGVAVLICVLILGLLLLNLQKVEVPVKEKDKVYDFLEDIFQNVEYITSTKEGPKQITKLTEDRINEYSKKRLKSVNVVSNSQTLSYVLGVGMYSGVISYMYKLYTKGEIRKQSFESQIIVIGKLFEIIFNLGYYVPSFYNDIQLLKASSSYVKDLYSWKREDSYSLRDSFPEILKGDIVINNLTFAYHNQSPIFDNYSVRIKEGEIVALYGDSGSGKTTFTKLLLGRIKQQSGVITIGEYNVGDMPLELLRFSIANVNQNTTSLMQMTIYENIIFGLENDQNNLKSKLEELDIKYKLYEIFGNPQWLNIKVSKSGTSLSGGQKQIVHLLHAILNDKATILLLDEPTSALDSNTKSKVLELVCNESFNKTVLIVTHDDAVLEICNVMLKFKKFESPTYHIKTFDQNWILI